jgi:hypothetical protein
VLAEFDDFDWVRIAVLVMVAPAGYVMFRLLSRRKD